VQLCPPQIPHDETWDLTRAAAVGCRRLTAWARPTKQLSNHPDSSLAASFLGTRARLAAFFLSNTDLIQQDPLTQAVVMRPCRTTVWWDLWFHKPTHRNAQIHIFPERYSYQLSLFESVKRESGMLPQKPAWRPLSPRTLWFYSGTLVNAAIVYF
jgi:hypothetical protein